MTPKISTLAQLKALVDFGVIRLHTVTRDVNGSPRDYIEGFSIAGGPMKRINPRSASRFAAGHCGTGVIRAANREWGNMTSHKKLAWAVGVIRAKTEQIPGNTAPPAAIPGA